MLTSFELEASFFNSESRCDLHSEMAHHLLEQAYMNLRIENDQILARSDFSNARVGKFSTAVSRQ